jgi:hypothetical protein
MELYNIELKEEKLFSKKTYYIIYLVLSKHKNVQVAAPP